MKVIEVFAIVLLTYLGITFLGFLLTAILGFTIAVIANAYEKYAMPERKKPKKNENWQCSNCGRINSPRAKICTKCGFEKPIQETLVAETKEESEKGK